LIESMNLHAPLFLKLTLYLCYLPFIENLFLFDSPCGNLILRLQLF
jgi:hypothetical protein